MIQDIVENGHSLNKPVLFCCALGVGIGISYYYGSLLLTKMSSIPILKLISAYSLLEKLPIFEQHKELFLFDEQLAVTLLIKIIGDNIQSIQFRLREDDDDKFRSISDALELFIEHNKEKELDAAVSVVISDNKTASFREIVEALSNSLEKK